MKKSFPSTSGVLRSDYSFLSRKHPKHHSVEHKRKSSVLERYGFQMVTQFPLDVMHLVDFGLGKLIVRSIFQNEITDIFFPARPITMSKKKYVDELAVVMSNIYEGFNQYCPDLFARNPRPLDEYVQFKATEFRQFLL